MIKPGRGWPALVQVPYDKSMFAGSGTLVWTVDAADYHSGGPSYGLHYAVLEKLLYLHFACDASSVSGTGQNLLLRLPKGLEIQQRMLTLAGSFWHTNTGSWAQGQVWTGTTVTNPGDRWIRMVTANAANWSSNTNNLYIRLAALVMLE